MPARVLLMAREVNLGGSERQMTETARFLDRSLFDPRVGCFRPAGIYGDQLRASGVPVVHFPVHSYRSPAAITGGRKLIRYIRDERIDLVHAFDYPMNVFAVPLAKWFTPARAVASQRFHREITPRGYLHLLRRVDRIADATVVNCNFLREHLVNDEGLESRRVEVCHNGIDLSAFCPGLPIEHPGLRGASLVIGVLCVLRPEKGLATLLDAFARVRHVQPGVKLAVVGTGPMLDELQQRARNLGIQDDCLFEPATNRVPEWLRAMDIFVLPSLSEAFSNALMEAMACGCCTVASNAGGNPELVKHNETGMIFERGNPESLAQVLHLLIENPDLRKRLAANGRRAISENFSIQAAAKRMGEIYLELLARRGKMPIASAQEPQAANCR